MESGFPRKICQVLLSMGEVHSPEVKYPTPVLHPPANLEQRSNRAYNITNGGDPIYHVKTQFGQLFPVSS